MKKLFNISFLSVITLVVMMIGGVSCEKEPHIAQLPNMKKIICIAGDRPSFSFSIGVSWQLSSDATWCKFITSAGEVLDMSGNAGSHVVTLKITDENIKNEPTFANITIKADGKAAIIVNVERGANELYMRLYDVTDTPKESIELGYNAWIPFRIEANFRFALTDYPAWVELGVNNGDGIKPTTSITGVPGEQTEAYARIICNNDRERYVITKDDGHKVTFSDEMGDTTISFPIIYQGMGPEYISFVGPTDQYYGWEVSLDGKMFRQNNEATETLTTFNDKLEYDIIAHDDVYQVLYFEQVVDRGIPSYVYYGEDNSKSWMHFDKQSCTFSVDATDHTRRGMALVMPIAHYNRIRGDIMGNLFELDYTSGIGIQTLANDFLKYVFIEFTQMDFNEPDPYYGMSAYHSLTIYDIPCEEYHDSSVMEQYGVTEAYTCPFINSVEGKKPGLIVDPRIEGWTTLSHEGGVASAEVWYKGEKLKISENEYYIGENKDEVLALHLWGPNSDFTEDVHIVFTLDKEPKKLLVVTPPAF